MEASNAPSPTSAAQVQRDLQRFVEVKRRRKAIKLEDEDLKREEADLQALIIDHIENERTSASQKVDGATVFLRHEIWAGPKDKNHDRLIEVLDELHLEEYLPDKVNSQKLSGFVREAIRNALEAGDVDELDDVETRAAKALDPRLAEVLSVTEKTEVRANGL